MKTYKTAASEADRELTDILGYETRFYKEGLMDNHILSPVRLDTTLDEAILLLFEKSVVRPAFKIDDHTIEYPCLFFKVDGDADALIKACHKWKQNHVKTTLMYSGFHMIDNKPTIASSVKAKDLEDTFDGLKDVDVLSFLTPVKRKILIDAYHTVKKWVSEAHIDIDQEALLATCLLDNKVIIDAFHFANPVDSPPKCIVNDSQRKAISVFATIRILFLHALGFDIVVISKHGFASIENEIPETFYNRHVASFQETSPSTFTLPKRELMIAGGVGVGIIVLFKLLSFF